MRKKISLGATNFKYFYCCTEFMPAPKIKYRCSSCNWKFTRNLQPQLCPYCGKAAVGIDKAQGAQDLLKEIEDAEQGFRMRV